MELAVAAVGVDDGGVDVDSASDAVRWHFVEHLAALVEEALSAQ